MRFFDHMPWSDGVQTPKQVPSPCSNDIKTAMDPGQFKDGEPERNAASGVKIQRLQTKSMKS